MAARFVGHRVSKVQVDFLDKSGAFFRGLVDDTQEFVDDEPSSNNATSSSEQTENYAEDGRMGFVVYEPSIIWINTTRYQSVDAYNSFAGTLLRSLCVATDHTVASHMDFMLT